MSIFRCDPALFVVPARPPWRASESQRLLETTENLLTGKTYAQSEPDIVKYWEIIADNLSKAG